jgi:hypothetical protein
MLAGGFEWTRFMKPFDVSKEMVRITKPGGRVGMGN